MFYLIVLPFLLLVFFLDRNSTNALSFQSPPSRISITTLAASQRQHHIYYDSSNNLHRDIKYHPEQALRIDACVKALQTCELLASSPSKTTKWNLIDAASNEELTEAELTHARDMVVLAHSEEYVSRIERKCRDSKQRRIDDGKPPLGFIGYVDDDTYMTTETYDVCLRATAMWIRAVDHALDGGERTAFVLSRPPGHHATRKLSNGFCLFNFMAAAALHATARSGVTKLSILDWDIHYGQGVADIVRGNPAIRYASIHQVPAFPFMGETLEVTDNIKTIPIDPGTTWDSNYETQFMEQALPFVVDEDWVPDLVLVSSGYDGMASDELATSNLVAKDFATMTRLLKERLESYETAGNRSPALMMGMEGGYQLGQNVMGGGLPEGFIETIKALDDVYS